MLLAWVSMFGGLFVLVWASDWLVDGAIALSKRLGLSPLVVGLTIVAYGTSLPEFVVSLLAANAGEADMAVGNVVGSNIANLGLAWSAALIVGVGAITQRSVFRREVPAVLFASCLFYGFALDGIFTQFDGAILLAMAIGYTLMALRGKQELESDELSEEGWTKTIALLLFGFAGLLVGADFMVDGAIDIARGYGVDERIIGLTVVALGTSLPEVAATVTAARKGSGALALGNILGSCLFNLTFVVGGASLITPLAVTEQNNLLDAPVMLGLSILTTGLLFWTKRGERWHGIVLLLLYLAFMTQIAWTTFG